MYETKYRALTWEEEEDIVADNNYRTLVGPNGFECCLCEPEDRTWLRDGKAVVEELNRLHDKIAELTRANPSDRHPGDDRFSGRNNDKISKEVAWPK